MATSTNKKGDVFLPSKDQGVLLASLKSMIEAAKLKATGKKLAMWDFRSSPHEQFRAEPRARRHLRSLFEEAPVSLRSLFGACTCDLIDKVGGILPADLPLPQTERHGQRSRE